MLQYILFTIYVLVSSFLLYSAYLGIYKPNNENIYGVFCQILADDKMVSYASQLILTIITASLFIYIKWHLLAVAVLLNMGGLFCLEYLRLKKKSKNGKIKFLSKKYSLKKK